MFGLFRAKFTMMEDRTTNLPQPVSRIVKNEDSLLGFFVIWFLGLTIFPLGAFYFGTIASPASNVSTPKGVVEHFWDLRVPDMHVGGWYALGGLALGICFGIWATFIYPRQKELDAAEDARTAERLHEMLSHHDEISTDMGQKPSHVVEQDEG